MIDYDRILRNDEKAVYRLRELFGNYGYRRFKTGKFEEYELYAENKDFLSEDGILTFTDARGKLMALKPDVTLSIAKMAEPLPETRRTGENDSTSSKADYHLRSH